MPKFKHSVGNYIKLLFVLTINPLVYLLYTLVEFVCMLLEALSESLPKLDLDWTEDNKKIADKVRKEYFKLVRKENKCINQK